MVWLVRRLEIVYYFEPLCLEQEDTANWFKLNIFNEAY